jgi:hypothetical protein
MADHTGFLLHIQRLVSYIAMCSAARAIKKGWYKTTLLRKGLEMGVQPLKQTAMAGY